MYNNYKQQLFFCFIFTLLLIPVLCMTNLYIVSDLGHLMARANKNVAPLHCWSSYGVCRVLTQNKMFKYKLKNIFLLKSLYSLFRYTYYRICQYYT